MDDRLQKALEFSNRMATLALQKDNLKMKMNNLLSYSYNGGIFKITPELISFIKLCNDMNRPIILLDINENPIRISDTSEFLENILDIYFEVTNSFYNEYEKIKKSRTVQDIVGLLKNE